MKDSPQPHIKKIVSRLVAIKPYLIKIIISAFHAFWMLIVTYIWLNQNITYGDEMFLIQMTSGIRHLIFNRDNEPDKSDFLFINVSNDRQLIDKKENGVLIGNQDITDRKKLAQFFHILNQKPDNHKFIICDIYFKDPSPDDELLMAEMRKVKNILIPYHQAESGKWEPPIFDIETGLADYITADANGTFLKFGMLDSDMRKTIPLIMYEKLHHAAFEKKNFLYFMNGKLSLNSIILDFRIRNYNLFHGKYRNFYMNLGELLREVEGRRILPDMAVLELMKDRIVVMGDFTRDIHKTVFGFNAGPLILLNVYLSLIHNANILSLPFLIFLFLTYLIISYHIFFSREEDRHWLVRILELVIKGKLIVKLANYLMILGAFSVALYFIYNIHINILLIATYIAILERMVRYFKRKKSDAP